MSEPWLDAGTSVAPQPQSPRGWPTLAGVAVVSALITATVTALITSRVSGRDNSSGHPTAPAVTVTATPPPPAPPAPLPTAQADRQTCNAWHAAGDQVHAATQAQNVIPKGVTILDPAVRENPEWAAAVKQSADLYGQAGRTLVGVREFLTGDGRCRGPAAPVAVDVTRDL